MLTLTESVTRSINAKTMSAPAKMAHTIVNDYKESMVRSMFKHGEMQSFYERIFADIFVPTVSKESAVSKSFTEKLTSLLKKLPPQSKMPQKRINGIMASIENQGEKSILNLSYGQTPWTSTFWGIFDRNKTLREGIYMDHECKVMFNRKPNGIKSVKCYYGNEERHYKGTKDSNWMLLTRDGAGFIRSTKSFFNETSQEMIDFLVSVFS